jgi:hypothetical protein
MIKAFKRGGYIPDHRSPLFPNDFNIMHSKVKESAYDIWHLMNYTMCLGAIYFGARSDYYTTVKEDHLTSTHQYWYVSRDKVIECLAQWVREKTDQKDLIYKLIFENTIPKRCYLRHLLILIHVLKCSPGCYIFPEKHDLI